MISFDLPGDQGWPTVRAAVTGTGMGVIEAPRGLLYHMARVDEEGVVEDHDVIVPTAQNQINIENDLRDHFLSALSGDEQRPERPNQPGRWCWYARAQGDRPWPFPRASPTSPYTCAEACCR